MRHNTSLEDIEAMVRLLLGLQFSVRLQVWVWPCASLPFDSCEGVLPPNGKLGKKLASGKEATVTVVPWKPESALSPV